MADVRDVDRSQKRKRRTPHLDRRLAALAAPRGGVVARAELLDLGLTRGGIDSRIREGRLHPIFRGVYAVGHPRLAWHGWYHAAILAAGPGAALSHHSAGALWDVRRGERLEVTVPGSRRGTKGLRIHRSTLPPHHVTERDGLPVTTVARTLLDLAEVLDRARLERVWEAADRLQVLDVAAVRRVMDDCPGRRGLRPLGALLGHHCAGAADTRSDLERAFLAVCAAHGVTAPAVNAAAAGHCVDCTWPGHRLVVEIDSWRYHRARDAFDRDRDRDVDLALAGFTVARFTDRMLDREPARVAARVRALLAATATRAATAPGGP